MMATDEHSVLQNGATCLSWYLAVGSNAIAAFQSTTGTNGIGMISQVIARLLHPSLANVEVDPALLYVGALVIKLFKKAPSQLGPYIGDMLKAVLERLQKSNLPSLRQSLILVFAHIANSQTKELVDFLSGIPVNASTGLEYVLNEWTRMHPEFQKAYETKISIVGLCKILSLNHGALLNLPVKGDPIVELTDKIVTRSRAKMANKNVEQFTVVPFAQKMLSLLAHEVVEEEAANEDIDDDEWEEDEEEEYDAAENELDNKTGRQGPSPFASASDYQFLSDYIGGINNEEMMEEDDPDIKNDPVYALNLKTYASDFIKTSWQGFSAYVTSLPTKYQEAVKQLLSV